MRHFDVSAKGSIWTKCLHSFRRGRNDESWGGQQSCRSSLKHPLPGRLGTTPLLASSAIHSTKHLGTGSTATVCHQEIQYPVYTFSDSPRKYSASETDGCCLHQISLRVNQATMLCPMGANTLLNPTAAQVSRAAILPGN